MPQILFYHAIKNIDLSNFGYARHFKFLKDTNIVIPNAPIAQMFKKEAVPLLKKSQT